MSTALKEAAQTINKLAKMENDVRRQLCIAIAGAQDLVRKAGLSWREWANENLRKPDGSKWSMWTLYSYASYGRDPKKLEHCREVVAHSGRRARQAQRVVRHMAAVAEITPAGRARTLEVEKQLQWLMSAWKRCSPAARQKFLEIINEEIAA